MRRPHRAVSRLSESASCVSGSKDASGGSSRRFFEILSTSLLLREIINRAGLTAIHHAVRLEPGKARLF